MIFSVNVFTTFVLPALVITALAAIIAFFLSFLGNKLKVDHDERIDEVRGNLSGANCGGCGFAGCDAFAEALVKGEASLSQCHSTPDEGRENIAKILGIAVEKSDPPLPSCIVSAERTARINSRTSERTTARSQPAFRAAARRVLTVVSDWGRALRLARTARSRSEKTTFRRSITRSAGRAARAFPLVRKVSSIGSPRRQKCTSAARITAREKRLSPLVKKVASRAANASVPVPKAR